MRIKLQVMTAVFAALMIFVPIAHGQANLTFSGGRGAPLSITLQQSVTYTINTQCSDGPFFVFDEAGNPFDFNNPTSAVSGTIFFSINGNGGSGINTASSGFTIGDISRNDIFLRGNQLTVAIGDTVTLSAGTLTTNGNLAAAPPANGSFTTFIIDANGNRCTPNGVAAGTTAASVSISGRVTAGKGRGLANALVYLNDQNGNTKVSRTNSFGYYRFGEVQAGQTVIVTVASKRYQFDPKVINLTEDLSDVDFTAQ